MDEKDKQEIEAMLTVVEFRLRKQIGRQLAERDRQLNKLRKDIAMLKDALGV